MRTTLFQRCTRPKCNRRSTRRVSHFRDLRFRLAYPSSDEENEEERDDLAQPIAAFEREFDAIMIAEYPTIRQAA